MEREGSGEERARFVVVLELKQSIDRTEALKIKLPVSWFDLAMIELMSQVMLLWTLRDKN